jgi:hypothetical protein
VFGFHHLGIDEILVGPVNVGAGLVRCEHGLLPVRAGARAGAAPGNARPPRRLDLSLRRPQTRTHHTHRRSPGDHSGAAGGVLPHVARNTRGLRRRRGRHSGVAERAPGGSRRARGNWGARCAP